MCVRYLVVVMVACGGSSAVTSDAAPDGTDGSPDAGATATVVLQRAWVGASVIDEPLVLAGTPSFFVLPGYTEVPATETSPGTWSAPIPAGASAVFRYQRQEDASQTATPIVHVIALPTASVTYADVEEGRPGLTVPPANTSQVALDITLPSAVTGSELFTLTTLGAPSSTSVNASGTTLAATVAGPAPWPLTTDDQLLVLRYDSQVLTGSYSAPAFAQTGGTSNITGTMTAVTPTETVAVSSSGAFQSRFGAAGYSISPLGTVATAAPGLSVGDLDGPLLSTIDPPATHSYGNPFSWPAVMSSQATGSRTAPNGGSTVTLRAGFTTAAAPAATFAIDVAAGVPTGLSIGGTAITTDGTSLTAGTGPVPVAITTDRTGDSLYILQAFWYAPSSLGTSQLALEMVSTTPAFSIPPGTLLGGSRTYYVRITTVHGGFTGSATGDLRTFTLPMSSAYVDMPTIRVN